MVFFLKHFKNCDFLEEFFQYWFYIFNLYSFNFQRLIWKIIIAYFVWFDHWTVKEWNAKMQNHSASAYKLLKMVIGPLKFTAVMFVFFCKIHKYVLAQNNILSCLMTWPDFIVIIWKWASLLTGLPRDGESIWSGIFFNWNLTFFQAIQRNGLPCLLGQPAPYKQFLIQPFLLAPECYFT